MSKAADLMPLGFSWPLAQAIGYSSVAITAAGTTSTDATACDTQNSIFIMTATGSDGIRMSTAVPIMKPIMVVNTSGSTGKVYPFTGGNFNGGSTDAGISVATLKAIIIMRLTSTLWLSNLSA
jgi:hypothetical protein